MATILVVDDNSSIRQCCKDELTADGHRVLLAGDGRQALDVLAAVYIDLVILDVQMPRMNGWETLRAIRAWHAELPVILHTAIDMQNLACHERRLVTAFIVKSQRWGSLREKVRDLVCQSSLAVTDR